MTAFAVFAMFYIACTIVSFVYSLWWSLNFAIIYWGVQQRFRESKLCKVFPSFCPGVKAATCDTQWSLLIAILCFTAMERRIFAIHSCLWCQTWNFGCPEKRTKTTYVAKMSLILWILQVFDICLQSKAFSFSLLNINVFFSFAGMICI